jgi:hypothetical protein
MIQNGYRLSSSRPVQCRRRLYDKTLRLLFHWGFSLMKAACSLNKEEYKGLLINNNGSGRLL